MSVTILELPWPEAAAEVDATTEAARLGDRTAWSNLVSRHDRLVVLTLIARGIPPAQARELAQEAWMKLIRQSDARRLTRLELPGLAIRQALFLVQSARRAEGEVSSGEVPEAVSTEATAEERYASREQLARASTVLRRQHPMAQRVFQLSYGEPHLSHAEVAERVGLSLQRVRQILCEVRKALRAELQGVDDE